LHHAHAALLGRLHERADSATLQKFGKQFRPHRQVCTDGAAGNVHCHARVVTDDTGSPLASGVPSTALTPAQLLSAYGLSGIASGVPIIAIVDAYDDRNIVNDLKTYSTTFNLPQLPTCTGPIKNSVVPCFQKMAQNGSTTNFPFQNSGWALEIALDVETAHAMCQNCSILLVEANSATYTNLMTAVDRAVTSGAKIVSNSYGGSEFSGETTYDSHFNKNGIVFTFSSGDSGYGAQYPAASKYVTAVGGTSLFLNSDGTYNSESAWSGAGSGCSAYEGKQAWQADPNCPTRRMIADVSAVSDPNTGAAVYDSVRYQGQSGWFQVGGTSLAAPLVAAVYALSGNVPNNSLATSLPYSLGTASTLHDVTAGSNGSCGGSYLCTALLGYDGPTGLGSPRGVGAF